MQKTKWLTNFLLSILVIIIFLFALEIFFMVFFPQDLNYFQLDNILAYKGIPNFKTSFNSLEFSTKVQINDKGLRDYNHNYNNPEYKYRILFLGDSMTFGYGVEMDEAYPKVLGRMLNSGEENYETINAGITGYDTTQELAYLEKEGLRYNPNLVVLGFMFNDVPTNYLNEDIFAFNGSLVEKGEPYYKFSSWKKLRNFLSSRYHLYNFLKVRLGLEKRMLEEQENKKDLVIKTSLGIDDEEIDKGWEKTFLLIKEMKNVLDKKGTNFLVVIIPTKWQVDDKGLKELIEEFKINENVDINKPNNKISNFLEKEKIKHIVLLDDLKSKNKNNDFYYEEGHFNKKGHELVAELIYEKLKEENLV